MNKIKLVKDGIRHLIIEKKYYFMIKEVKAKYVDVKIDTSKILTVGNEVYIPADGIEQMTEFDKKIMQTLNFNPKGK
jgi:hypothetical protein